MRMTVAKLLDRLGYADSENYLSGERGDFDHAVDYGHLFRKAAQGHCRLQGVYTLRGPGAAVPVAYVCDAASEDDAGRIHRLVWNQGTVPFLIVNSPQTVRVYPGFSRQASGSSSASIGDVQREFDKADLDQIASTLSAAAVDSGQTWGAWGRFVRTEHRVDSRLLGNLRELDAWLQGQGGLAGEFSHALIGKYVYLYYLRHRDILSDKKLQRWGVDANAVFGREATVDGLQSLLAKLDDWLNGEVFPLDFSKLGAPGDRHVGHVAATFSGDAPVGAGQWQLYLDFKAYDFSYIPIEVLSVVYEQFLHAPSQDGTKSRGRSAGAYYTPIPVVNLMLAEMEERRPLTRGMRVFDPACGSGAFLVQAFRRLIEKEFPPSGKRPTPGDLRRLVEEHFVGLDTDPDACNITRLSLILTLLDYVYPPDLEVEGRRKPELLPSLRDNVFHGNFFDDVGDWQRAFSRRKADWVIGNPPWKQLKKGDIRPEDEPVLKWIKEERKHRPVGNCQAARAFAWRAADYVNDNGEIGLFLPAMTLFEEAAQTFRSCFLQRMTVRTIVNFSNLRWVISAGRFTAPAAAFFYRPRGQDADGTDEEEFIRTFSPLLANQEATRREERRNESWSIILNASEIADVPLAGVVEGYGLPWKIATWGSPLDAKLIRRLQSRFPATREMVAKKLIIASEGPQLKDGDPSNPPKGMEPVTELLGKPVLNVKLLRGMRDLLAFPKAALGPNERPLLRLRGGKAGLEVCRGPHVVLGATRTFAVYCQDFLIVPPRQIGFVSPTDDVGLLKALAVFLKSEIAFYCEFFLSSSFGIERDRSTLKALLRIPTPLLGMQRTEIKKWSQFHDRVANATARPHQSKNLFANDEGGIPVHGPVLDGPAVAELNELVADAMGLADDERALIHDMVRVRLTLIGGKLGKEAVGRPSKEDMQTYGRSLQEELDGYTCGEIAGRHSVEIVHDDCSGMVCVTFRRNGTQNGRVPVMQADASGAMALEKCRQHIRRQKSQWVYFDRNLRVYDGDRTCIFKPMQRFHWTRTQARIDAMDIVPESMARRDKP